MKTLLISGSLFLVLIIPPIREGMEGIMLVHMLIQLPLLIFSGWLLGKYFIKVFPALFEQGNQNGVPGIILIFSIPLYWMLPRAMDDALTFPIHEILKFISLPVVGILLADSWKKIKTLGKGFIYLNYLSMFGLMGWLYLDSPIQLCNNYLVTQQKVLGWGYLSITIFMVIYVLQYVFIDHSEE